jgi:hypothetical protein
LIKFQKHFNTILTAMKKLKKLMRFDELEEPYHVLEPKEPKTKTLLACNLPVPTKPALAAPSPHKHAPRLPLHPHILIIQA